jgi:hypothetical protein
MQPQSSDFQKKVTRADSGEKSLFNQECWENWVSICIRISCCHKLICQLKTN